MRVRESAAVLLCLLLGMGRFSLLLFFSPRGGGWGAPPGLALLAFLWVRLGGGGRFRRGPRRSPEAGGPSRALTRADPPLCRRQSRRPGLSCGPSGGGGGQEGGRGEVAGREGGRKRRVPGKRPGRGIAGAWPRCLDGACCCLRCPFGCAWRLCWQSSAFKRAARKEPALVFFLMIEVLEWAAPIFALSRLFFFFLLFAH